MAYPFGHWHGAVVAGTAGLACTALIAGETLPSACEGQTRMVCAPSEPANPDSRERLPRNPTLQRVQFAVSTTTALTSESANVLVFINSLQLAKPGLLFRLS